MKKEITHQIDKEKNEESSFAFAMILVGALLLGVLTIILMLVGIM
jgi:hypothetical protein